MAPAPNHATVSARTAARIRGAFGRAGAVWLDGLPATVARALRLYDLVPGRRIEASYSYVEFVRDRSGAHLVLKVAPPGPSFVREVAALRAWDGCGTPAIRAVDPSAGILVSERVMPGTPLADRSEENAAAIIAAVARRLARCTPSAAASDTFTPLTALRAGFERARATLAPDDLRLPASLLDEADSTFGSLLRSSAPAVLLHGDLHHWNVLDAGDRGWMVIDPKGYLGEPAFEFGAFLRNPVGAIAGWEHLEAKQSRRVDELSDRSGIDGSRIRAWGFAQAVLSACWSVEDGEDSWRSALVCAEALRRGL